MKIETIVKSHLGQPVKYSNGITVTYDNKGVAEVSNEDGKYLTEYYQGQIFTAGKVVIPEAPLIITKKSDNGEISALKEQLQRANKLANDCKTQAQSAKDGEGIWRAKCEELLAENKQLKAQGFITPTNIINANQPLSSEEQAAVELTALKKQLEAKTIKNLQGMAEELTLPKDEYKNFNKATLIEYLIGKTTNATT